MGLVLGRHAPKTPVRTAAGITSTSTHYNPGGRGSARAPGRCPLSTTSQSDLVRLGHGVWHESGVSLLRGATKHSPGQEQDAPETRQRQSHRTSSTIPPKRHPQRRQPRSHMLMPASRCPVPKVLFTGLVTTLVRKARVHPAVTPGVCGDLHDTTKL